MLERAEVGRDERIGRRDRREWHAHVLRRERQEQVFDAVARENRQRTVGRQLAIE